MTNPPAQLPVTADNHKLHGLDHLRALAIGFVFMYHYGRIFHSPQWLTDISKFGWTGVDLFFVLSGYLIASPLFAGIDRGESIALRTFFIKRFFRIIPAYLLVVGLYFYFPLLREREAPAPLWKYLSFTQNLGLDLRTQGSFSHAWSLCIEEQFYFLFPLMLALLVYVKWFKKSGWLLAAFFIAGFVLRWYAYAVKVAPYAAQEDSWVNWYTWIYYPTYSRLDGLLTGVSLAALFQFKPLLRNRFTAFGNLFLLAGLAVLTCAYLICLHEQSLLASVAGFPLVSVGYGLVVLGAISSTSFLYRFRSAVTAKIAALSYAIYLTHKIIIHLAQEHFAIWHLAKNGNRMLLICLGCCLLGAWFMNTAIEKPFLRLRKKILSSGNTG